MMSWRSGSKIDERKGIEEENGFTRSERINEMQRYMYSPKDKELKKYLRKDKNDKADKIAKEAQKIAELDHFKTVNL